ncbi:MAG: phytanoyl-CoA dioxygenase family protein [Cyanobacteriota bacterium]
MKIKHRIFRRTMRNIHTLLAYPACLLEMIRCKTSPYHINSFATHTTAVYAYLLSRGYSEWIDALIFGPRLWRSPRPRQAETNCPKLLQGLTQVGYAHNEQNLSVDNLIEDLKKLQFIGRVANDKHSLDELEKNHLDVRGRYDAEEASLMSLQSFARLVTSEEVHQIARAIMGERYLLTSALVWASFACDNTFQAMASAQIFHMDYDYLDDIKLFVNLSDTDSTSGPLEYVAGSHRPGHKKIWSSESIPEERVWRMHGIEKRSLFTGKKGEVYISDNRGLHRDAPPSRGAWKLAIQVNFSRNQFGSEKVYASQRVTLSPDWPSYSIWSKVLHAQPYVYSLLFSPQSRTI